MTTKTRFFARCNLPAGYLSKRDLDKYDLERLRKEEAERYGRCDETFTDGDAFTAHMAAVHGRKPYSAPTIKPYAHVAPKAPSEAASAKRLAKVAEGLAAGKYDIRAVWDDEETAPAGEALRVA